MTTTQPDAVGQELTKLVAGAMEAARTSGNLSDEECVRAKQAMRHGAVAVRRDDDGTILVTVGSVFAFECHILDLPSIATQWEASYKSS